MPRARTFDTQARYDSRALIRDLLVLLGFSAAVAVTAGAIKTPIGVPGHSAVFWIPVLALAGCQRRGGMAVGAALIGGMMGGMWCGMGMAKVGGLLASAAVIEAFALGKCAQTAGWRVLLAAMLGHLAKLTTKLLAVLVAGLPLNRVGLPLLPSLALYVTFGLIGGAVAWGILAAWSRLRGGRAEPPRRTGVSPVNGPRGFTLIELLVVIAIIAILAAILFPVFARARAKARQSACLSNIKQLSLAIHMYAQDYDEMLLPSAHRLPGGGSAGNLIWPAYLTPYVQNTQVFICPDASTNSYYADTWGERGRPSVGLNRDLEDRTSNAPYSLAVLDYPAETIALADSTPGNTGNPERARGFQVQADRRPNTRSGVGERHCEGTNVGLLDGHAKWYKSSTIWQLNNSAGLRWRP